MDSYPELKYENLPSDNIMEVGEKKILHFSDGILEVDDVKSEGEQDKRMFVDPNTLPWAPWMWHYTAHAGSKALEVCDFVGEFLATFFGITTPKYQYEITEYHRLRKLEEECRRMEFKKKSNNRSVNDSPSVTVTGGVANQTSEDFQLESVACTEPETKC